VFILDFISHIDGSIIVRIVISKNVFRDHHDIFTSPSTFTFFNNDWALTVEFWIVFYTVFSSPRVFTGNHAVKDFTGIKSTIIIGITIFNE